MRAVEPGEQWPLTPPLSEWRGGAGRKTPPPPASACPYRRAGHGVPQRPDEPPRPALGVAHHWSCQPLDVVAHPRPHMPTFRPPAAAARGLAGDAFTFHSPP